MRSFTRRIRLFLVLETFGPFSLFPRSHADFGSQGLNLSHSGRRLVKYPVSLSSFYHSNDCAASFNPCLAPSVPIREVPDRDGEDSDLRSYSEEAWWLLKEGIGDWNVMFDGWSLLVFE